MAVEGHEDLFFHIADFIDWVEVDSLQGGMILDAVVSKNEEGRWRAGELEFAEEGGNVVNLDRRRRRA